MDSLKQTSVVVQGIKAVLARHQPDIILLMSGANGFDEGAREALINAIVEHSQAHLYVATITPQVPPRDGWEGVAAYNHSLRAQVEARRAAGQRVTMVDVNAALSTADLLTDGVHPAKEGMEKIADVWFRALKTMLDPISSSSSQSAQATYPNSFSP